MRDKNHTQLSQQLSARWGSSILSHGWTAFPNLMFELRTRLQVKHGDVFVLLAIESHRWTNANPYPSISTIARLSGFSEREVYRALKRLEDAGLVERRHTNKRSNEYDNSVLLEQLNLLCAELGSRPTGHDSHDELVVPLLSYRSDEEDLTKNDTRGAYAQREVFYYSQETYDQAIEIAQLFQKHRGGIVYRDKWETDDVEELIVNEGYRKVRGVAEAALMHNPSTLCYPDDEYKVIPMHRPIKLCDNWHALLEVLGYEDESNE